MQLVYDPSARNLRAFRMGYEDIAFKSSYLYESFPVLTKNGYFIEEADTFGYIVV